MTRILRIDPESPEEDKVLVAADFLKRGRILIYPTETVYGIGCSMESDSVDRIFEIKGRGRGVPLSVAFSGLEMASRYIIINDEEREFIAGHVNEPYTFVVRKRGNVPDVVTAGKNTVGVRIPDHALLKAIIGAAGTPIISTSANVSGGAPPARVDDVSEGVSEGAELIIDAGPCRVGVPSRVIDLVSGGVLRE